MINKYLPYQLALIYLVNKRNKKYNFFSQKHISNLFIKNNNIVNSGLKIPEKYLSTPCK
jgi:hypothetical protein